MQLTPRQSDINYIAELNDLKPATRPPYLISKYIDGNRIMPPDSPFPGKVELWRSQYAVEIMDCFSPYNQTRYIDLMSAAQVVKTFIIEDVIGYGMGPNPSSMLYVSGTEQLLAKWSKRLEPMIDSLDLRKKFHANIENTSSRKDGDKNEQKLFTGGFLELASAQSESSMRSDSVKWLFLDEVDAAPRLLTSGGGRWDLVAEARTKQWENRKKIGAFSTPKLYDNSIIFERFSLGDQCLYFMPCPLCGKFQILDSIQNTKNSIHGLKVETKAGEIEYVYYLCDFCHDAIFEHHKNSMIPAGKWEPQTRPEKFRRSFQINSLYAIYGGYSWLTYYMDYQTAINTPDGLRSFTNLNDGMPYREPGTRPKTENVITLRGTYKSKTVPDHILFLTMAVDVQRGSDKEDKKGPRLEIEILGHSSKYRTASILYKVIPGKIDDPYSGAWETMHQWALKTKMEYKRRDEKIFRPVLIFLDSGDGEYNDIVYNFSTRWGSCYPIKGSKALQKTRKDADGDEKTKDNFMRYKLSLVSGSITLVSISTNYYKLHIYNVIDMSIRAIQDGDTEDRAGFQDFPMDYSDNYFEMLTAEEKRRDGSFHDGGRRNESLDLRVYNQCAGDMYLDEQVKVYREWAKEKKWSKADIMSIDTKYVLNDMEKSIFFEKT